jgi:hypothetical protein
MAQSSPNRRLKTAKECNNQVRNLALSSEGIEGALAGLQIRVVS